MRDLAAAGSVHAGHVDVALQLRHQIQLGEEHARAADPPQPRHRELYGLLLTCLDRDGHQVTSRLGVATPAIHVEPGLDLHTLAVAHWPIHYMVCDEAQFYTPQQIDQLGHVVEISRSTCTRSASSPTFAVSCSKAPSDCSRSPTNGCHCRSRPGAGAVRVRPTTRRIVNGVLVYEGETVMVGDTADASAQRLFGDTVRYELLCRRHYRDGDLGT